MLNRPASPYMFFVVVGLLAHGLMLFNDGSYGDGWVVEYYIQTGNWAQLQEWYDFMGRPWFYWVFRAIGNVPKNIFDGIIFVHILILASFLYILMNRYTPLNGSQSLLISLIVLVWPFYHVAVNVAYVPQFFWATFFIVGWVFYFYNYEKHRSLVFAFLSCLMIFISLFYESFMVYHFIFLGVFYCFIYDCWGKNILLSLKENSKKFILDYWILGIMPFVALGVTKIIFKPLGVDASYNSIKFSFKLIETWVKYVIHILIDPFKALYVVGPKIWFILIPAIILAAFFVLKKKSDEFSSDGGENHVRFICLGLLIIIIVGFPFAAVGKYPDIFAVRARHGFYAAIGYGFLMMGMVVYFFRKKRWLRSKWKNLIFCQIIVCFIVINIGFYASWQGRWAKYLSISANLTQTSPLDNVNIYFLRDESPTVLKPNYEYNDFTLILNKAWGGERFLGVTPFFKRNRQDSVVVQEAIKIWHTKLWQGNVAAGNFKSEGCVGEVAIKPKFNKNEIETGFLYLYYKLFQSEKLDSFVLNLVTVDMRSLGWGTRGNICT